MRVADIRKVNVYATGLPDTYFDQKEGWNDGLVVYGEADSLFRHYSKIKQTYVSEKTDFQDLAMIETEEFGNMLVLDGMVMTTVKDEFVYHEMVAHPALNTHPNPKKFWLWAVAMAALFVRLSSTLEVEKAVLVEIDGKVIEYSKKYLPEIAGKLDEPNVEVLVNDGYMHIIEHKNEYDVIMVDSTEPVGPAAPLFERGFYQGIFEALKEDGIFVAQTDNPWFKADLIQKVNKDVKEIFPIVRVYGANIPTYPSGFWTFTLGSKKYDPLEVDETRIPEMDTRYYSPRLHKAAFVLPKFVEDLTK